MYVKNNTDKYPNMYTYKQGKCRELYTDQLVKKTREKDQHF